jgi:hypothetical protein
MSIRHFVTGLSLAGILFVLTTSGLAQQQPDVDAKLAITPEKRAVIGELLEVLEVKKQTVTLFNSILDQDQKQMPDFIWQGILSTKAGQDLSADSKEELRKKLLADSDRLSKRTRELFLERLDMGQIVEEVSIDVYDKYFTEAELKDLIAFYKTATGKKAIEVMPKMFGESMAKTMEAVKPKALEIMTEMVNEEAERVKRELQTKKSKQPANSQPSRGRRKPRN